MANQQLLESLKSNPFNVPHFKIQSEESLDVPERRIAAASAEGPSCEFGSSKYYAICGFGGVLSCGVTHTAIVPLDLVKCRIQVDKEKYKNLGNGFKLTLKEG